MWQSIVDFFVGIWQWIKENILKFEPDLKPATNLKATHIKTLEK